MGRPILTEKTARRGHHIYRGYGIDPLERHGVAEVMSTDVRHVGADATLGDALATRFGPAQKHRRYPVTRGGLAVGMVERDTLDGHAPGTPLCDPFGANRPVVARTGHAHLLGVVRRSGLIKATATCTTRRTSAARCAPCPWCAAIEQ